MINKIRSTLIEIVNTRRYDRLAKSVRMPEFCGNLENLKIDGYFSQYGQDKWIAEEIFSGRCKGVFVDIGANDGMSISNTYYLEKNLGWTGLAVEPIPYIYEKLKSSRTCATVNACVGAEDGTSLFRMITGYAEQLSGLVDQYHPSHLTRIENEINQYGGSFQDVEVRCYSLNTLLQKYCLFNIDYLSIDVEGSEFSIINGLDFNQFQITSISLENNYNDYRIPKLLIEKGYVFHSIVGDEFYVKR